MTSIAQDSIQFFCVDGPRWWGDYGDILVAGMSSRAEKNEAGALELSRTGPFTPPITFLPFDDVVVTSEFKERLANSGLGTFSFRPVVKAHIVNYHWEHWERSNKPAEYPSTGEPEDYINQRPHSPDTAKEMGDLWEVILPTDANTEYYDPSHRWQGQIIIDVGSWKGERLFKAKDGFRCILVTADARNWLEQAAGEWVTFKPVLLQRPAPAEFYTVDGNNPATENPTLDDLDKLISALDDPARKDKRGVELFHSSGWCISASSRGVVHVYNREIQHKLSRWMRGISREKQVALWHMFFGREWRPLMAENWTLDSNPFARGPEGPGDMEDALR